MLYSALQHAPTPRQAIVGACYGLGCVAAEDAHDEDLARIAGIHDLLCGVPVELVGDALEQVGFGPLAALAPAALSLASPVLSKVLPGAGGSKPSGGGGGGGGGYPPGTTMTCPGGPIIVRF